MKVAFILKGDPFSWKAHEAFRIATALGINHEVYFIFIRDGVYTLTRWDPEKLGVETFEKFFETIEFLRVHLIVEDASMNERGIKESDLVREVRVLSAEEISEIINETEAVFVW